MKLKVVEYFYSKATLIDFVFQPGEGGIIIIPGATILDSMFDTDEEILLSLEGPPSPCDVTFINDNVLIDGKSSLSQKSSKRTKVRNYFFSFVDLYL